MIVRSFLLVFFALFLVIASPSPGDAATVETSVYLEDQPLFTDTTPIIHNNRVMVPLRVIGEAIGAYVEWVPESKTVLIMRGLRILALGVGRNEAELRNISINPRHDWIALDASPILVNNRVLVPARIIAENMGAKINWDAENRRAIISDVQDWQLGSPDDPVLAYYRERYGRFWSAYEQFRAVEKDMQSISKGRGPAAIKVLGANRTHIEDKEYVIMAVDVYNQGKKTIHVNPHYLSLSSSDGTTSPVATETFGLDTYLNAVDVPPSGKAYGFLVFSFPLSRSSIIYTLNYQSPDSTLSKNLIPKDAKGYYDAGPQ